MDYFFLEKDYPFYASGVMKCFVLLLALIANLKLTIIHLPLLKTNMRCISHDLNRLNVK